MRKKRDVKSDKWHNDRNRFDAREDNRYSESRDKSPQYMYKLKKAEFDAKVRGEDESKARNEVRDERQSELNNKKAKEWENIKKHIDPNKHKYHDATNAKDAIDRHNRRHPDQKVHESVEQLVESFE